MKSINIAVMGSITIKAEAFIIQNTPNHQAYIETSTKNILP